MNTENEATLEERFRKLELEVAERRPVEKLMRILIYFFVGLSIAIGLFGIKQFSDINTAIESEVRTQFPKDQRKYLDYKLLIEDTEELNDRYKNLFGKYESALKTFAHLDKVTDDFDLEGKISRITEETKDSENELTKDEAWRLQAIATLRLLVEAQKKRNFQSDFIFNAAQAASRLQQNALAYDLMQVAYTKRPNNAPIQAGRYSAIVEIGDEKEVEDAFKSLMKMVANLDSNSPHIVLSEAWNAAEHLRKYDSLIAAIDQLLKNQQQTLKPSYAYFIKAFALTRASRPGDLDMARSTIEEGLDILSKESPNAVWYDASIREYLKCLEVFNKVKQQSKLRELVNLISSK